MNAILVTPPDVHACVCGDDIVFLDVRADRYFAARLSRATAPAATLDLNGHVVDLGEDAVRRLRARGLVAAAPAPGSSADAPATRPWKSRTLAAWAAGRDAAAGVRPGRLQAGLRRLRRRKARVAHTLCDEAVAAAELAWFRRWRPWWPARRKCLFDSLALAGFLLRRGARADVVFGVRTGPFAAHCWVERDGVVLLDAAEYCAAFTPLLRI